MQRKKIKFHNRTKKKMFIDICVIFRIETSCSALGWKRSFKRWKRSQKLLDYWIDLSVWIDNACAVAWWLLYCCFCSLLDRTGFFSYFLDIKTQCYNIEYCIQEANTLKYSTKIQSVIIITKVIVCDHYFVYNWNWSEQCKRIRNCNIVCNRYWHCYIEKFRLNGICWNRISS